MLSPRKSLPRLAAPLVLSFTLRFLFQTVDLVYATFLENGQAAVAAIGFWSPFQAVFIAIWVGLSAGFTATLSNAFGRRDEARIGELKRAMRRILAWLVPALTAGGVVVWLAVPHFGLEPDLTREFRIYATTLCLGMPVTGFWSIYPDSIVKAHHDTRSTMVAGLVATFTNIGLNTVFVFVFGWGVFGLAFATVLSRITSLAYAAWRARELEAARRGTGGWTATARDWPAPVGAILQLSVPGALTFVLTAAEGAVVNALLKDMPESTAAIAAYAVYERVLTLALMPTIATAVAVLPYVARNLPEGHVAEVSANLRRTLVYAAVFGLALTVPVGLVFPVEFGGFFVAEGGEVDARAVAILRLLPIAVVTLSPFYVLRPVFEATQRARIGIAVSVLRFVVLSIPLAVAGVAVAGGLGVDPLQGLVLGLIGAGAVASVVTFGLCFPVGRG